jgi:hypothetical protein
MCKMMGMRRVLNGYGREGYSRSEVVPRYDGNSTSSVFRCYFRIDLYRLFLFGSSNIRMLPRCLL